MLGRKAPLRKRSGQMFSLLCHRASTPAPLSRLAKRYYHRAATVNPFCKRRAIPPAPPRLAAHGSRSPPHPGQHSPATPERLHGPSTAKTIRAAIRAPHGNPRRPFRAAPCPLHPPIASPSTPRQPRNPRTLQIASCGFAAIAPSAPHPAAPGARHRPSTSAAALKLAARSSTVTLERYASVD